MTKRIPIISGISGGTAENVGPVGDSESADNDMKPKINMPLYTFECRINGHVYDAIRPLTHSGVEPCERCEAEGRGFAFAHRVISHTSVHIPGRSVLRKLADDTIQFAERQTRIAEARSRKVRQ